MRATRTAVTAAAAAEAALVIAVALLGFAAADSGRASTDSLVKPSARTGYGCKFVPRICSRNEVCFDDNLFGSCKSLLDDRSGGYWYTADANLRDALENVLNDLLDMGYSWKDEYTQCVVDAVLRSYRQQTIFRASVCSIYGTRPSQGDLVHDGGGNSARGRDKPKMPSSPRLTEMERLSDDGLQAQLSLKDLETLQFLLDNVDDLKDSGPGLHTGVSRHYEAEHNTASRAMTTKRQERMNSSRRYADATQPSDVPGDKTQPTNVPSDEDALLLKLLTGELEPEQVTTDAAQGLVDYIGSLLHEARSQRPIAGADAAAAAAAYGDAGRRFSPPSKLSGAAAAVSAESMAGLGADAKITRAFVSSGGRRKGTDSGDSVAVDAPRQLYDFTESSRTVSTERVTASSVTLGSKAEKAETVLENQTASVSQNETYVWMVLSSSISSASARRLVTTLESLLSASNVTSVARVRIDHNTIVVTIAPNSDHHELDYLVGFIADHKDAIEKILGVSIMKSGVGSESATSGEQAQFSMDSVPLESASRRRQMFIVIFVLCGAAVGIGGALAFICVIRRCQLRGGWKLAPGKDYPLSSDEGDEETGCLTHDYEDLVRQHIHSKTSEQSDSPSGSMAARDVSPADEAEGGGGRRSARSSQSSWSEEPAVCSMDVSTGHMILSYMEDHLKNKDRLEEEWQSLCSYRADLGGADVALLPKNKKRNRYTSVLPYDHNRVVLDETKNVSGDDYINASFVADHHPRTASYIATQGPLATSVADFWQMVWERGTVVVVMLTRLNDQGGTGGSQCHRYWPSGSSELYHIYEVHLVSEHVWCDDYLVRSFYLKNLETNETRTVTQFHFLAWPEGGVPMSTKSLLDFRRKMNKSYRGRSCPIVVVCSDGAGRSGAFILLDMVINRLCKGAKEIDIAATLEHIRDQRMAAVQTKEQFEFVLSAIAEEVQAMLLSA